MNIAASYFDILGGSLYIKVVKSSLIISIVPPEGHLFSLTAANTCLNNVTVLEI